MRFKYLPIVLFFSFFQHVTYADCITSTKNALAGRVTKIDEIGAAINCLNSYYLELEPPNESLRGMSEFADIYVNYKNNFKRLLKVAATLKLESGNDGLFKDEISSFRPSEDLVVTKVRRGIIVKSKHLDYRELERFTDELTELLDNNPSQLDLEQTFQIANEKAQNFKSKELKVLNRRGLISAQEYNIQLNRIDQELSNIPPNIDRNVPNSISPSLSFLNQSLLTQDVSKSYDRIMEQFQTNILNVKDFHVNLNNLLMGNYFDLISPEDFLKINIDPVDIKNSTLPPHLWEMYLRHYGIYIQDNIDTFTQDQKLTHLNHYLDQLIHHGTIADNITNNLSKQEFESLFSHLGISGGTAKSSAYIDGFNGLIWHLQFMGKTIENFPSLTEKTIKLLRLYSEPSSQTLVQQVARELTLVESFLNAQEGREYLQEFLIPKIEAIPNPDHKQYLMELTESFNCSLFLDS